MYTKSIIQQKIENIQVKNNFKSALENLLEKYTIEDSVFMWTNKGLQEVVEGYFVSDNEYNTLSEAISACDITKMGIRITGNVFNVGSIHTRISECDENKSVFDLKRLETVR